MFNTITRIAAMCIVLCGIAEATSAQTLTTTLTSAQILIPPPHRLPPAPKPRPRRPSRAIPSATEPPSTEVGIFGGLWGEIPYGPTGVGGRLSLNRSDWFSTEVSVEGKPGARHSLAQGLVIMNARIPVTDPEDPPFFFLTAGVAAGPGFRRTVSPILGFGGQTLWAEGLLAARGEVQFFPGGPFHGPDSVRLMFGIVVALR